MSLKSFPMSEVFEGVLCSAKPEELSTGLDATGTSSFLNVHPLTPSTSVAYRIQARQKTAFSTEVNEVAAKLSELFERALVVRYDSRIGHRSAEYFVRGQLERAFGEEDELFVGVDEAGMPLESSPVYRLEELDPDVEYETKTNAIQLGLDASGLCDWETLFRFMTSTRT